MSKVIVREFNAKNDSGFIYATWPKSVYYSGINTNTDTNRRLWFDEFHQYMQNLLPEAEIKIACLQEDKDFILAYSIVAGRTLQFIYVKDDYRKQGIAKLLLKHNPQIREINEMFVTRIGDAIRSEHKDFFEEATKIMTKESIEKAEQKFQKIINEIEEGLN